MTLPVLMCQDIDEELDLKISCCDSCHEDYDDYGYAMVEKYVEKNGKEVYLIVCCAISIEL